MKYFREILKIAGVEFAAAKSSLPSWSKKGLLLSLIYAGLALALFSFIFHDKFEEPLHLMASVTVFMLSISYIIALFHTLQFSSLPYRYWWLTLPYPRYVIVFARLFSMLRIIVTVSLPIFIAGMAYYVIALERWGMQSISFQEFVVAGVGFVVLLIVGAPIVIMLGFLLSTLYSGWVRWTYIVPYFFLTAMSFSAMILVELLDVQYLSVAYVMVYALLGLIVGWPITYLLLRYIANVGMYNMANVNSSTDQTKSFMNKHSKKKTSVKISPTKQGFAALYQLERSRYTYLSSLKPIRLLIYVTFLIIAIVAYISGMKIGSMNALGFVAFLVTFPLIIPVFWSMMINTTESIKNRLEMWLCFPYSRMQLLVARIAAVWVTALRLVLMMSIVFWAATIAACLIHSTGMEHLRLSVVWFIYGLVLYVSTLTISMSLLQIQSFSSKSNLTALLIAPLYFFVFYQTVLLLDHFVPEEFRDVTYYPDWTLLVVLIVSGLPLGLLSIRLGAKYLNFHLRQGASAVSGANE